MKKVLSNTYINILFFIIINLTITLVLKNINNINEYLLMLIDFSICFSLLALFAFYFSKTNNNGKDIFKETILIGLAGTFFLAMFSYVYLEFINPSEIINSIHQMEQELSEQGYNSSQINQAMSMSTAFTNPVIISIMSFFGYGFSVLISSLMCKYLFSK